MDARMCNLFSSLLAVATVAFALPATADQLTAGELLGFCSASDSGSNTVCRFFVLGVVEGVQSADGTTMKGKEFVEGTKTIMCLPDNLPASTMVAVVRAFIDGVTKHYPDDAKLPAVSAVLGAMAQRYPCR